MGQLRIHGRRARDLLKAGDPDGAQVELEHGWAAIPEPKRAHEESLSFVRGTVRLLTESGHCNLALRWVKEFSPLDISEIDSDPDYVIGVTYYECGDLQKAFEHLRRANEISKGRCFQGEDKKYLTFLFERLKAERSA
jgi:hypothetical protein